MTAEVPIYDLYGEPRGGRLGFWIHCETIAARSSAHHWEIGLHRHDIFQQFLYIRSGSGDAMLGGNLLSLIPPCLICIPPGINHGFRFSPDIDGLVITLLTERLPLVTGLARRPQDWLSAPHLIALAAVEGSDYLDATLSRLLREVAGQGPGSNALIEAYLKTMVLMLNRMIGTGASSAPRSARQTRIETLERLIGLHFRDQWRVADYAGALNITPTHLNRLVREALGTSVHDLVMARVTDEACRSLVFTHTSIHLIAEQLGFADGAYFIRWFRKRTGLTPGLYRKMERQRMQEGMGL